MNTQAIGELPDRRGTRRARKPIKKSSSHMLEIEARWQRVYHPAEDELRATDEGRTAQAAANSPPIARSKRYPRNIAALKVFP
jgi:hypothetical protein